MFLNLLSPRLIPFFKGLIRDLFQQILALQNPNLFFFLLIDGYTWVLKMHFPDCLASVLSDCICFTKGKVTLGAERWAGF